MNVLVISTDEYLTMRLLKCLAFLKSGVHVIGVGRGMALRSSRYCLRYTEWKWDAVTEPTQQTRRAIDDYCRTWKIDVILPSGMPSVFLLAVLREQIEAAQVVPLSSSEVLKTFHNKWTFAQFLSNHRIPFPLSRLLQNEDFAQGNLDFPVIVKPLELDAGRGVVRCDTTEALKAHVRRCVDELPLLVQEYIPGTDVGLGILARQGDVLAWTIQKQALDGSGIEFIAQDDILEIGRQIMAASNYDGIAHFDMRIDSRNGSVKVLECNPRFWASLPFCMVAGVNFADLSLRLAQGQPLPPRKYHPVEIAFPSKLILSALRGRGLILRGMGPSRRAFGMTCADPLPYLAKSLFQHKADAHESRRRNG